jgi:hypothetical protein
VLALVLACAFGLAACGKKTEAVPVLSMPDVVGMPIIDAETSIYGSLHTSLLYYDQSPANRDVGSDWVVISTYPAAGAKTKKYKLVYAWALQKSEYDWFKAHPTMPVIPKNATSASLLGTGGLFAPVSALVQLRYQPGSAPSGAAPSTTDKGPFTPDRGNFPDPSIEPPAEYALQSGLLVASVAGTDIVSARPAPGAALRTGQYLVLLAAPKSRKHKSSHGSVSPSSSRSSDSTSGGGSSGRTPHLPSGLPTKINIPTNIPCPSNIC